MGIQPNYQWGDVEMIKLVIILALIGVTFSTVKKWVVRGLEKAIYIKEGD